MQKTKVYITIDTECREERLQNQSILPAAGYDLRIWGNFKNQEKGLGIELIMDTLESYGFKGSFFLDPFGAKFFGLEGLQAICKELLERGHDVQLHAHPIQKNADWISADAPSVSDMMFDYSLEEQTDLLAEGMDILVNCGVPRKRLKVFRAGHFSANKNTWEAMKNCGIVLGSSYNLSYLDKTCHIEWPKSEMGLFDSRAGAHELPISNFMESSGGYRHLQISAISALEMQDCLLQAQRIGYEEVTILTHSFEFLYLDSVDERKGRLNKLNLNRLQRLCHFLDKNTDLFTVETVGELALNCGIDSRLCEFARPAKVLKGKRHLRYLRMAEQLWKRLEEKFKS